MTLAGLEIRVFYTSLTFGPKRSPKEKKVRQQLAPYSENSETRNIVLRQRVSRKKKHVSNREIKKLCFTASKQEI